MTAKFNTLKDCIAIATLAHSKDTDKSGFDYIEHPLRVMRSVQAQGAPPYVQMAAVLHDVTEDTFFTAEMLIAAGVPLATVELVKLLDRDYSYELFLKANEGRDVGGIIKGRVWFLALGPDAADVFYYSAIRDNPGALQVKLADIGDNTQPWRMSYLPDQKQVELRTKYDKALDILLRRK